MRFDTSSAARRSKAADLLVLEKNPLDNIANMRSLQTIYLGAKKFE